MFLSKCLVTEWNSVSKDDTVHRFLKVSVSVLRWGHKFYATAFPLSTASFSPEDPLDGDTLSIACGVKPWPWGATVSWRLNGEPFLLRDHGFTEENFSSGPFYLKGRASGNVTGDWTCIVHQKGSEARVTRALTVRGKGTAALCDTRATATAQFTSLQC